MNHQHSQTFSGDYPSAAPSGKDTVFRFQNAGSAEYAVTSFSFNRPGNYTVNWNFSSTPPAAVGGVMPGARQALPFIGDQSFIESPLGSVNKTAGIPQPMPIPQFQRPRSPAPRGFISPPRPRL